MGFFFTRDTLWTRHTTPPLEVAKFKTKCHIQQCVAVTSEVSQSAKQKKVQRKQAADSSCKVTFWVGGFTVPRREAGRLSAAGHVFHTRERDGAETLGLLPPAGASIALHSAREALQVELNLRRRPGFKRPGHAEWNGTELSDSIHPLLYWLCITSQRVWSHKKKISPLWCHRGHWYLSQV